MLTWRNDGCDAHYAKGRRGMYQIMSFTLAGTQMYALALQNQHGLKKLGDYSALSMAKSAAEKQEG